MPDPGQHPRLSLIISVYNNPPLLRKMLRAVAIQTRLPDEVVIADDGSSDEAVLAACDALLSLPCPVKYVWQAHAGFRLAKSRNNAVRETTGDILAFLDQDILCTRRYLELCTRNVRDSTFLVAWYNYLTAEQSTRVTDEAVDAGAYWHVLTRGQQWALKRQFIKEGFYRLAQRCLSYRVCRLKIRGGAFALTRRDFQRVDGFDESFQAWGYEDDDLGWRLNAAGVRGRNVFWRDYALHLYHPTSHRDRLANRAYYLRRRAEIAGGSIQAVRGLSNPLDGREYTVRTIRS